MPEIRPTRKAERRRQKTSLKIIMVLYIPNVIKEPLIQIVFLPVIEMYRRILKPPPLSLSGNAQKLQIPACANFNINSICSSFLYIP